VWDDLSARACSSSAGLPVGTTDVLGQVASPAHHHAAVITFSRPELVPRQATFALSFNGTSATRLAAAPVRFWGACSGTPRPATSAPVSVDLAGSSAAPAVGPGSPRADVGAGTIGVAHTALSRGTGLWIFAGTAPLIGRRCDRPLPWRLEMATASSRRRVSG
jgi:hypothetical protein